MVAKALKEAQIVAKERGAQARVSATTESENFARIPQTAESKPMARRFTRISPPITRCSAHSGKANPKPAQCLWSLMPHPTF
jgi:hypothetical protein